MDGDQMDINTLSDGKLAEMLREYGVDVGPILDTTRRVYQRKLLSLLNDGSSPTYTSTPQYEEYEEYEEEEEEEEEDPEIIFPRPAIRPKSCVDVRQRMLPQETPLTTPLGEDYTDFTDRPMTAAPSSRRRQQHTAEPEPPKQQTEKKGGGLSIWIQLAIFVVVALLIFLVIQNMEPAREDPLKQLEDV